MAFTQAEKAFCVLEFAKTKSWTLVQRAFCTNFGKGAPESKFILRRHGKFMKDECFAKPRKRSAAQLHMYGGQKLDYRLDVCCVTTNGAHIEHYMKNLRCTLSEYIR